MARIKWAQRGRNLSPEVRIYSTIMTARGTGIRNGSLFLLGRSFAEKHIGEHGGGIREEEEEKRRRRRGRRFIRSRPSAPPLCNLSTHSSSRGP
jgi:hypothetical protein